MEKIRIKSTPLFKQVAAVIGEERAQIELAIAYHDYRSCDEFYFDICLRNAFSWRFSPQGYEFWDLIYHGINPCKN